MVGKIRRPKNGRVNSGGRAFSSGLQAPEDVLGVLASERASAALRHSQRNAVGSELVAQTKVQTFASGAWYPGAARQWLPRLPSCERNSDEQFRSIAENCASRGSDTPMGRQSRRRSTRTRSARTESELRRNLATQFWEFWTLVGRKSETAQREHPLSRFKSTRSGCGGQI